MSHHFHAPSHPPWRRKKRDATNLGCPLAWAQRPVTRPDASAGLDAWIRPKILLILALCCACAKKPLHPPTILVLGSLRQGIPWGIGFVEGDDPVAHADGRRRRAP
jgi:hypothetical protein